MSWMTAVLVLAQLAQVFGGGKIRVQFERYNNGGSKKSNGDCCDFFCYTCDNLFTLTYCDTRKSPHNCSSPAKAAPTGLTFDDNNASLSQLDEFEIAFWQWTGDFKLDVEVMDEDWPSADDHVVSLSNPYNNQQLRDSYPSISDEVKKSHTWTPTKSNTWTLELKWKAACDTNYYGDCTVPCKAENSDEKGHFACDNEGRKVCLSCWTDVSNDCKTADICSTSPPPPRVTTTQGILTTPTEGDSVGRASGGTGGDNTGLYAGVAAGAVVLIIVFIIIVAVLFYRRNRQTVTHDIHPIPVGMSHVRSGDQNVQADPLYHTIDEPKYSHVQPSAVGYTKSDTSCNIPGGNNVSAIKQSSHYEPMRQSTEDPVYLGAKLE